MSEGGSVPSSANVTSNGAREQSQLDELGTLPIKMSFMKKSKTDGAAPQSPYRIRNVGWRRGPGVGLAVGVGPRMGVVTKVGVAVIVGVDVGVGVGVELGVRASVAVGVAVSVGVAVNVTVLV